MRNHSAYTSENILRFFEEYRKGIYYELVSKCKIKINLNDGYWNHFAGGNPIPIHKIFIKYTEDYIGEELHSLNTITNPDDFDGISWDLEFGLKDFLPEQNCFPVIRVKKEQIFNTKQPELKPTKNHFEKNIKIIMDNLEKAKYSIWIAVAYITNKKIIDIINNKFNDGLDIRIITVKDENYEKNKNRFKEGIEIIAIPKGEGIYHDPNNSIETTESKFKLMHLKMCVIDMIHVLNGSTNWSYNAKFSGEEVTEMPNPHEVTDHLQQIVKLRKWNLKFKES